MLYIILIGLSLLIIGVTLMLCAVDAKSKGEYRTYKINHADGGFTFWTLPADSKIFLGKDHKPKQIGPFVLHAGDWVDGGES